MEKIPDAVWSYFTGTALRLHAAQDREYARNWLTKIIGLLIDRNEDGIVLDATNSAPHAEAARLIRSIAERESEVITLPTPHCDATFSLFVVPLVIEFQSEIPASIVNCILSSLDWMRDVLPELKSVARPEEHIRILACFHSLDDLLAVSLSSIRKTGQALANHPGDDELVRTPFSSVDVPLRRSTTFLRFIVGQRMAPKIDESSISVGVPPACQDLAFHIETAVIRRIGQACCVDVFQAGPFHDAIYTGMWRYQERRLDQIARDLVHGASADEIPSAMVSLPDQKNATTATIGFSAGTTPARGINYRLRTRPAENMARCATRIGKAINASGITKVDCILSQKPKVENHRSDQQYIPPYQLIVLPL